MPRSTHCCGCHLVTKLCLTLLWQRRLSLPGSSVHTLFFTKIRTIHLSLNFTWNPFSILGSHPDYHIVVSLCSRLQSVILKNTLFIYEFVFFFRLCSVACGILVPQPRTVCSLYWEHRILTTGPPRKSLNCNFDLDQTIHLCIIARQWVTVNFFSY